jgi:uncharacterized protein (DUF885 family)
MWRAIRLVVDTGVHSKHWTSQQMVDYFHKYTAMDEPNINTEVDRYIAFPGQALAYKVGQMTILRLREQAKQHLVTNSICAPSMMNCSAPARCRWTYWKSA